MTAFVNGGGITTAAVQVATVVTPLWLLAAGTNNGGGIYTSTDGARQVWVQTTAPSGNWNSIASS
jgi:hypothetical protein